VQRLLKYALLHAIIEATPDSHGEKDDLRCAKSMVVAVLHTVNEGQRRHEIVKEAFVARKPAELLKKKGLGMVGRVLVSFSCSLSANSCQRLCIDLEVLV